MVAWVQKEPAAPLVRQFLLEAEAGVLELSMSRINAAETFYILAKRSGMSMAEQFLARLPSLPVRVTTPDEDEIMAAARIKARHAVAFGDAFAIALAQAQGAAVITGDEEIRRCRLVRVEWVGARRA
ncbi:MAG TPA: type II toxin-antitoxin system VapC family toxin [Bryobacteraceae bacterium]|nr:type II toxin-antitoxin system VapC family toxin [Bryobacteraceae bacterium]